MVSEPDRLRDKENRQPHENRTSVGYTYLPLVTNGTMSMQPIYFCQMIEYCIFFFI